MEITEGSYVYFQGGRFRVHKILSNGRLEIIIRHRRDKKIVTRTVSADEVTTANMVVVTSRMTDVGFFPGPTARKHLPS
jgi:hypothetical protein